MSKDFFLQSDAGIILEHLKQQLSITNSWRSTGQKNHGT